MTNKRKGIGRRGGRLLRPIRGEVLVDLTVLLTKTYPLRQYLPQKLLWMGAMAERRLGSLSHFRHVYNPPLRRSYSDSVPTTVSRVTMISLHTKPRTSRRGHSIRTLGH